MRDLSLDVGDGEVVGIVGESGSGKTMTALSLLGLLPEGVRVSAGTAELSGQRFLDGPRLLARPNATMIFQNPTAALNPTMRIGAQLERLLRFLDRVGRTPPDTVTGGTGQRRCSPRWASTTRRPCSGATRTSCPAA